LAPVDGEIHLPLQGTNRPANLSGSMRGHKTEAALAGSCLLR
jgi:hypothetical protein